MHESQRRWVGRWRDQKSDAVRPSPIDKQGADRGSALTELLVTESRHDPCNDRARISGFLDPLSDALGGKFPTRAHLIVSQSHNDGRYAESQPLPSTCPSGPDDDIGSLDKRPQRLNARTDAEPCVTTCGPPRLQTFSVVRNDERHDRFIKLRFSQ
jgi:hypothetical protein